MTKTPLSSYYYNSTLALNAQQSKQSTRDRYVNPFFVPHVFTTSPSTQQHIQQPAKSISPSQRRINAYMPNSIKSQVSLPTELLLHIFTFLPLTSIPPTFLLISKETTKSLQSHMCNGWFFREREKRGITDAWVGENAAKARQRYIMSGFRESLALPLRSGFPQLLHDMYLFSKIQQQCAFFRDLWNKSIRSMAEHNTSHLSVSYLVFVSKMDLMFSRIRVNSLTKQDIADDEGIRSDIDIMLFLIHWDFQYLDLVSDALRQKPSFIRILLRSYYDNKRRFLRVLEFCECDAIYKDERIISHASYHDVHALAMAKDLRQDDKFMIARIMNNPLALQYASNALRRSKEVVFKAYMTNNDALQYFDSSLFADREFVTELIANDTSSCSFAIIERCTVEMRADESLIMKAIMKSPRALGSAAESLRSDRKFVKQAVQQGGPDAFGSASVTLCGDKNYVIEIIMDVSPHVLKHASDLVRGEKDVVLRAVSLDGMTLQYSTERWLGGPQQYMMESHPGGPFQQTFVIRSLGHSQPQLAHYTIMPLFCDRDCVITAVSSNGLALQFASDALRSDADVVRTAVMQNPHAIKFSCLPLQSLHIPHPQQHSSVIDLTDDDFGDD